MTKSHLTFYDTSRAYYAGYYLHGFKELESDDKLQVNVIHVLPMRLKPAIQNTIAPERIIHDAAHSL